MKKYFLNFDVFSKDGQINKFWFGIVELNLNCDDELENCFRSIVNDEFSLNPDKLTIRVNALNNIEY